MVTDTDAAERPVYSAAEAARYVGISPQSVARWRAGYSYPTQLGDRRSGPLVSGAPMGLLSFNDLVEVAIVSAARKAKVSMPKVRKALIAARELYASNRPLLLVRFQTDGKELFTHELEPSGGSRYVNLSRRGQIAWDHIRDVLKDLEYDESGVAFRWWPVGKANPVVIDPRISFGRPFLIRRGISTDAVFGRFQAGESMESILDDYELTGTEVEAAVRFESRTAA